MTLRRILLVLIGLPIILLVGGTIFWYLAYGSEPSPPVERSVAGLSASTTVTWLPQQTAIIETDEEGDFYHSLGYAHGVQRGWTAVLWRQTGLGRTAEWFGEDALPLDSLARKAAFASSARQAFDSLTEEHRQRLAAYTRGMNAALESQEVRRQSAFVLLDHEPAPWEPWHSLVVEQLFAWLAATPSTPGPGDTNSAPLRLIEAYERLQQWLQVHGTEHSTAWTMQDSTGTALYTRHVQGASAIPLYHEIVWNRSSSTVTGATLPGYPVFLSGRSPGHSWTILPRSEITLQREPFLRSDIDRRYERLTTAKGDEFLLGLDHGPAGLALERPPQTAPSDTVLHEGIELQEEDADSPLQQEPAPADSAWHLQWRGYEATSDFGAWFSLADRGEGAFQLFMGEGLLLDSTGNWSLIGSPETVVEFPGGVIIGQDEWVRYRGAQLAALVEPDGQNLLPEMADQDSSAWAAEYASELLASVDSVEVRTGESLTAGNDRFAEAVTYLRNWDFAYSPTSIGATIFDYWVRAYLRDPTAVALEPAANDTMAILEDFRRTGVLQEAVEQLEVDYGTTLEGWRWELVARDTRHFPTWSPDTLGIRPQRLLARTRYAPIDFPGRGHPSSLSWGTTPISGQAPAPTAWEAWIHTNNWDELVLRRRLIEPDRLLGRYRESDRRPRPFPLSATGEGHPTTVLIPASE